VAFGYLFDASTGLCGVLLSYSGFSKLGFYNSLTYLTVSVVLDFILIPWLGLIGAAIAGGITIILVNALRVYHVYNLIDGILPFDRTFWKPLVAALVAGGATFVLKGFVLTSFPLAQAVVLSALMCVIYIGMIVKLRLSYEDRLVAERVLQGKLLKNLKTNVLDRFSRKRG
jgi:O-antigen/teichoic acid export membrane protein